MTHTKEQEAFNIIKKTIDLALQSGVIKTIEDSKLVFDSLDTLYKSITPTEEPKLKKVEDNEGTSDK
jgi:hypothetical protein